MAKTVNIYEAKTQLSRLINQAAAGEEIVIARNGQPQARLVPISTEKPRVPGKGAGQWDLSNDFNEPLPAELLSGFEGRLG